MIFGTCGSFFSSSSLSKSQAMVSIPSRSSSSLKLPLENLDTPITFFSIPAALTACMVKIAMLGPIFPPMPRSMISPSIFLMSSTNAVEGAKSFASNSFKSNFICCYFIKVIRLLIARPIKSNSPKKPQNFVVELFTCSPIISRSFATINMAIPINGTKKMVMLCANTMSSRGSFPNIKAISPPNIITKEMNSLTILWLRLLPYWKVSPNNEPPKTALPINEENEAPKRPIKNRTFAPEPSNGSKALPISAAEFTLMF